MRPSLAFCQLRDCPFSQGRAIGEDFLGFLAVLDIWAAAGKPLRACVATQELAAETAAAFSELIRQVAAGAARFVDAAKPVGGLYRVLIAPSRPALG